MSATKSALRFLLGRRLSNAEGEGQKIGVFEGIPAMGLDSLSSAAYGPEAALTILIPAGAAGLAYITPLMFAILALLGLLYLSYCQTIAAYPTGGGSYTVARENIGADAGLLAATALMLDYVLNVAVGISAGVAAITSAVPALQPLTLPLCLAILLAITLVNLRGTSESGLVLAAPTYLFIASWVFILALGIARVALAGGHPLMVVHPPPLKKASEAVGLWLLLRAFAAGCTAMTGVEAVSNGVQAFREPAEKHAIRTLTVVIAVLAVLLAAIAWLAHAYGIGAMDQTRPGYQSVLSQLAGAVIGRGVGYYVSIAALLAVLCLSANTSFVGFPRLCRLLANDEYLPESFGLPGRRLVYTAGILALALAAGLLLAAFGGITDRLIPLFAIGAFLAFTLSQAGMTAHWLHRGRRHAVKLVLNGAGATATAIALCIIIVAKFAEGAWITLVAIPCLFVVLRRIHAHYRGVERQLACGPLVLDAQAPPVVLVPIHQWNALARKALAFAMRLSPDVAAIHLTHLEGPDAKEREETLRAEWHRNVEIPAEAAGLPAPRLILFHSRYRLFLAPLVRLIRHVAHEYPDRTIAVLIPDLVKRRWSDYVLHAYRGQRLRAALLREGGQQVVVVNVPWHLEDVVS